MMKPLFYFLAKHGPWSHHVRVASVSVSEEVEAWLVAQGKKHGVDYEVLIEGIEHKKTKTTQVTKSRQIPHGGVHITVEQVRSIEPIIFFKDAGTATYVKLTWGGR